MPGSERITSGFVWSCQSGNTCGWEPLSGRTWKLQIRSFRHSFAFILKTAVTLPAGQLLHRSGDVAAHDRAGQQKGAGPIEVCDRSHRGGQVLFPDARDGVDAGLLVPEVVAIGFAHGAEDSLGDLGPAADDDEPLAEDLVEGFRQATAEE